MDLEKIVRKGKCIQYYDQIWFIYEAIERVQIYDQIWFFCVA